MKPSESYHQIIDKLANFISMSNDKNNNILDIEEMKEIKEYLIKLEKEQSDSLAAFWARKR